MHPYASPEPYGQQSLQHRRTPQSYSQAPLDQRYTSPVYQQSPSSPPPPSPSSSKPAQSSWGLSLSLGLPLLLWLTHFESHWPLLSSAIAFLLLYALDLANLPGAFLFTLWLSVLALTLSNGWFSLLELPRKESILTPLLATFVAGLLWTCVALQVSLRAMEQTQEALLHSLLPVVAPAVLTALLSGLPSLLLPFVFCGTTAVGCLVVGSRRSNLPPYDFCVSSQNAWLHTLVWQLVPLLMHLAMHGLLPATLDDWFDWLLVATVPYLLHEAFQALHWNRIMSSPYERKQSSLWRVLPVAGLASLALQQRHLVPLCHSFSFHFMGQTHSNWLVSLYWTLATVAAMACVLLWNKKKANNEPLLGEYHEDVVQLLLSLAGAAIGKSWGLPWNFTPLPILAVLGLTLWVATRMLRYWSIFLFVWHATGVVVFTYRFAGIDQQMELPLGIQISLMRFAILVVAASVLIGLAAGLSVRSTGGYGAALVKRTDATGCLLVIYSLLLLGLEIALMKRSSAIGVLPQNTTVDDSTEIHGIYRHTWAMATSAALLCLTAFMKQVKIIFDRTSGMVFSLALGKVVAVFIDLVETADGIQTNGTTVACRALLSSVLCLAIFAPRAFLEPVHVKTPGQQRRSLGKGARGGLLPPGSLRVALVYVFVFLPSAIVVATPYVLYPLANAIAGDLGGSNYYRVSPPINELLGSSIALWGLACLSMLNFYLPDGGGESLKKMAALAFLMGVGVYFAAPAFGVTSREASNNPYAALSSLGFRLVNRRKSRTGGWGLLSASLATLLAITGPLELRERRTAAGQKDRYLLLRCMVFSLMFGGGFSWFVIMLTMSEADWISLMLTSLCCLTLSFMGTASSVLGYFVELENFEEVEQLAKMMMVAFPLFLPVAGLQQLLDGESHPFGSGGWLSTYLLIGGLTVLAFAVLVGSRPEKSPSSRALANGSCVSAWICFVVMLYGRYGVAGLDYNLNVTSVMGIPAPVLGTILLSPILLLLQGESGMSRRSKSSRARETPPFGLVLSKLGKSNRWFPSLMSIHFAFGLASAYVIFLRGISGSSDIARSSEDVTDRLLGNSKIEHDLATLAEKTITHSLAMSASAKLASGGFWTSSSILSPMVCVIGLVATLPCIYLQVEQFWRHKIPSASSLTLTIPLNVIPLLVCRGIATLQSVAVLNLVVGTLQWLALRRADQRSRMQI